MGTSTAINVIKSELGIALSGALVFANVADFLEQGNRLLKQHSDASVCVIDCKAMQRIDSAGIALLLEWQRQCKNSHKDCRFEGLSEQAQALIQAYRLSTLISA